MQEYDTVRVVKDKSRYLKAGVHKGMVGVIMDPRCIEGDWLVIFSGHFEQTIDEVWYTTDIECEISEDDLDVISLEEYQKIAKIQSELI